MLARGPHKDVEGGFGLLRLKKHCFKQDVKQYCCLLNSAIINNSALYKKMASCPGV